MPTELRPPSGGTPPPGTAPLASGERVHLEPLARETAARFRQEFPDEEDRYGDAGFEWCVHDTQYLLSWVLLEPFVGAGHFDKNLRWLTRLLAARGYPHERVARDLELAADVLEERHPGARAAAKELRRGASAVRARARAGGGGATLSP